MWRARLRDESRQGISYLAGDSDLLAFAESRRVNTDSICSAISHEYSWLALEKQLFQAVPTHGQAFSVPLQMDPGRVILQTDRDLG